MKKGKLLLTSVILATTLFNTVLPLGKAVFANGNDDKKMYEVGKTKDGKVILSSAKKLKNSRAVGNVQGDAIRVTIGGVLYEGARITIDGKPSFCIDHELRAPWEVDTPYDGGNPFDDIGIKAIMSYGAFSANNPIPTDEEVLLTEIAMNNWLKKKLTPESSVANSHPYVLMLIQKAVNGDYPRTEVNFSKTNVKSDVVGAEQVSESVTLAGSNNQVTINVPANVTFFNVTTGKKVTNGKATVKAGEKFQMKAPLTYDKKYSTGDVKPEKGEFIPIMFTPFSVGYQRLVQGLFSDPTPMLALNVDFFARTGEVEIKKLDKTTGKVVPNTEFTVDYGDKSEKVKTDDKGEAVVKDILHDTKVKVTETFVPSPYILDTNNTKEVVIQAGKTSSVEFKNERATGKSTLSKVDNITETITPLNPNYPMTGAKYGWFKADGTLMKEFTLDDKLTATIDKQELGSYYWQETKEPVGYKIDKTKHVVELTYKDQNTPVVVKNGQSKDDSIRMNFNFQKLIQNDTNEMFKNGVEFTATNQRTKEETVITTATVDGKKGYGQFADMPLDDYLIEETKGVEGYDNIDPIAITHSYDKETGTFTFTVKDQKTGNLLNEEKNTQTELATGENVDLGTYTLKDKAEIVEKPEVDISTGAHTGDGTTNTFLYGEEAKFYDDSKLSHKNIEAGTKRAYETKLHAVYTDKELKETTEVVWSSGLVDYEVSDKEMTERVLSEYDYRKDKKVNEKTRWYFSEDGYNYDNEEPTKDTEHNSDGEDPKQDIKSVVKEEPKKEEPKKEEPKETPKMVGSFPVTGEEMMRGAVLLSTMILAGIGAYVYFGKKKKVSVEEPEQPEKTEDDLETK